MNDTHLSPYEPFDMMDFSHDECFLCGETGADAQTKEHVFPRWLLNRLDLWDKTTHLLNHTTIPYRLLTVPCCAACNSQCLSKLESAMKKAFIEGPEQVAKIDKMLLYQWMGKIFFGLYYRELSLLADRSDPEAGFITTPEFLKNYRALHGFLQSIRIPIDFNSFFPGSVFVFGLQEIPGGGNFDYSDNPVGMTFSIRAGNIGVVACLKDDGLVFQELSDTYSAMCGVNLHPMQFDEFCAIVFYRAYSMVRSGKYLSISSPNSYPLVVRVPGFSLVPFFEEWDIKLFAQFLASFWEKWGIRYEEIFVPPDGIRSTLTSWL